MSEIAVASELRAFAIAQVALAGALSLLVTRRGGHF